MVAFKDFGANGLRIGCIISQNNAPLLDAVKSNSYVSLSLIKSLLPFLFTAEHETKPSPSPSLFTYPPSISDHITSTLLEDTTYTQTYIRTNQLRLAQNYALATSFLNHHNIPYSPKVNAAFFLWIDLKPIFFSTVATEEEKSLQGELLSDAIMARLMAQKVFIANGESFAGEEAGWFRVVFSQRGEDVVEGLKRMMRAFEVEGA